MKQIGLAIHNYHSAFKQMPANHGLRTDPISGQTPPSGPSWMTVILPQLEQTAAAEKLRYGGTDFSEDSPIPNLNWRVMSETKVPTYTCPSSALESVLKLRRASPAIQGLFDREGGVSRKAKSRPNPVRSKLLPVRTESTFN